MLSTIYDQLRWNSPAEDMLCDRKPAEEKHEPEGAAEAHIVKLFQHCSTTELQPKPYPNMGLWNPYGAEGHLMNLACGSRGQEILLLGMKMLKDIRLRQFILVRKAVILCPK